MADSRETFLVNAFVTGWPVKHSRSPLIHGYWLEKFEIAGTYRPEAVTEADFPAFIQALKDGSSGFRGGNVTIPHKELAFRLADRPDDLAEELGASNTLWMENGLLHATNTDGHGFTANLDDRHPGWDKIDRAVILGAGGASRAVIQAIRDRGVGEVNVVNRTVSRAEELADRFGHKVHAHPVGALREVMSGAGLFVNTTSLGMDGSEAPKIDFSVLVSGAVVTDIVYVPLKTPLLIQAEEQGFPIVDGLGMLLHQAVPGFEKWFGRRPAVDKTLRDLVIADMGSHG
ncbi:shikimate dehydrogenase [Neorhizobium galegae]|uniref:shikimate dehydrogenase n=1 Tax=Neorhizobium galegae TaxID=399 RepID=UPI0006227956|nr:shikimate dehydrogenase [Neorhizobium galegae]CDZ30009.1 Shikimate dehydrogenase [Neorhizobium galegae bv. officinalis]KAA9385289.1 shikimate dehydrogenase [Neorhizobium galegae]KAB1109767.1 shikimate dehydrogenase [Neorhizobium galegae]MCM2501846.1 shikimate dehydrogenase [Neorhizobium galegae]MCQ1771945.1 shikimate dehydrogenase [Neorhizobium galegae]